jgi:hypothetical protein
MDAGARGRVIPVQFGRVKSCLICSSGELDAVDGVTFCRAALEEVDDEMTTAVECDAYEDDPCKS